MRKLVIGTILVVAFIATLGLVSAGYEHGANADCCDDRTDDERFCENFVDADGDGMNDLRPMDGTGYQYHHGDDSFRECNCHGLCNTYGYKNDEPKKRYCWESCNCNQLN